MWTKFLNFSLKNPKYTLIVVESCKGSPKVSADIFWAIGDLLRAQKSDFSQKIVQKLGNPCRPPPPLVSFWRDIYIYIYNVDPGQIN